MFSFFLVDGPRVMAKQRSCCIIFLYTYNSNWELQLFLYIELKLFLLRWTPTVLVTVNSNCSCYGELNVFLFMSNSTFFLLHLTQSVLLNSLSRSFYFSFLLREKSRQWPFHQCILMKCSVILYSATSLYLVSRVYSTLSTLDSALLCNSEILLCILILWFCTA